MKRLTFTCPVPNRVDTFQLRSVLIEATQRFVESTITAESAKTYGLGNPIPPRVAVAIARIDSTTWHSWHCARTRLAPPGVSVEIRDRSGKRIISWAFGGPRKPPFSVKSWRFSYESDARHCARVWARVDTRVSGNAHVSSDTRVYGNAQVSSDARVYGNAHVSSDTPRKTAEAAPTHLEPTEQVCGIPHAAFRAAGWTDEALTRLAEQAQDPLRWRQTTVPVAELFRGIRVKVIVNPLHGNAVQWRFIEASQGIAYDAKQAKP